MPLDIKVKDGWFAGESESVRVNNDFTKVPYRKPSNLLKEYETEEDLEWDLRQIADAEDAERRSQKRLMDYLGFWGQYKRQEIEAHRGRYGHFWSCPTCALCRCGFSALGRFWHQCESGKKQISPYRLAFVNSAAKRHALNYTWQIGVGFVPREHQNEKTGLLAARGLD